jgi:hypothetical protein
VPLREGGRVSLAERAKAANILVVDIERLPGLARVWDQKTRFVPVSTFERLPSTLCFAAKQYGARTTEFVAAWDGGHEAMIRRSWELYDEADIVVTYNGVAFDNKHLRADWRDLGLPPPRPWKDVDLYRVNRTTFGAVSYSLNHLCQVLGLDTKSGHYDAVLAQAALDGDVTAQRKMKRYNVGDVKITEQAYDRLRPYMHTHPHMGTLSHDEALSCNACGSTELERNGVYRAVTIDFVLYRCKGCGANVRGGRHSRAALSRGVR